jgi:uncharacterized protein (DUF362 family)
MLSPDQEMNRREMLTGCAALGLGAALTSQRLIPKYHKDVRPKLSKVAVLPVSTYSNELEQVLINGLKLFRLDMRGKSVLLKPNLVEYIPGREATTNAILVGAAAECFLRLGARSVIVAEGSGHTRDTEQLLWQTGLKDQLIQRGVRFVDLNRDDLVRMKLAADYSGLRHLWLPRTVLEPDFLVSMPKVKTHHWAGATLSMKNMFGIVPGLRYGWPKNLLHWHGIHESILDICATVPIHFVIADGILAMEGNGPLHGATRKLGRLMLADDPVAADATIAHLMGFLPHRIKHIKQANYFLGNATSEKIQEIGESIVIDRQSFEVPRDFSFS